MPISDSNVATAKCECGKEIAVVLSPQTVSAVRTIKCDNPECKHEVTYDRKAEQQTFEAPGNEWMKTSRVIQTADGRNHVYCSDACEVAGAATGKHNIAVAPPPPQIVPGNQAAVAAAVAAAKAKSEADAAIREGRPAEVNIQITDK
jgi:hypothetical protein